MIFLIAILLAIPLPSHAEPTQTYEAPKEIINNNEVMEAIYGLESSYGKNDNCKKTGKYNGFGYRQNKSEWVCYDTFEEVQSHVNNWLIKRQDWPINKLLCYYNTGKPLDDCQYYQKYLNLN